MALTVIPDTNADSFISVADATTIITNYSVHSEQWTTLTVNMQEVYLRIATQNILELITVPSDYDATTSCLPKACAMIAIHDIANNLSKDVNPNLGLVTSEKVGDLQITYKQYSSNKRIRTLYPREVRKCLTSYGVEFGSHNTIKLIRS